MAKDTRQQGLTEYTAAVVEMTKRLVARKTTEEPLPRQPETHTIGVEEGVRFDGGSAFTAADVFVLYPYRKSQGDRITPEIAKEAFPPDGVPPGTISNGQLLQRARKAMIAHGIPDKDISDDTVLRKFGRRRSRRH
jgi:hypothetical protein